MFTLLGVGGVGWTWIRVMADICVYWQRAVAII